MSPKHHQKKKSAAAKHHQKKKSAAAKVRAALDPKPPLPSSDLLPPRPNGPVIEQARPPPDRLISVEEMLTLVPVTNVTLWTWVRQRKFPKPKKVGKRTFWPQSVYDAWKAALPDAKYKGDEEVHGEA